MAEGTEAGTIALAHKWKEKKKKKGFLSVFNVFAAPFLLPPPLTHKHTPEVHKHSLKACIHLSKNDTPKRRRGVDGVHGNVGAREQTHTHTHTYAQNSQTHSFAARTHASQSLRQSLSHPPYLHLSFWTPGGLLRISSPQHFILIRHNICPQFNRQCSVLQQCEVCVSVCVCVCVCVRACVRACAYFGSL